MDSPSIQHYRTCQRSSKVKYYANFIVVCLFALPIVFWQNPITGLLAVCAILMVIGGGMLFIMISFDQWVKDMKKEEDKIIHPENEHHIEALCKVMAFDEVFKTIDKLKLDKSKPFECIDLERLHNVLGERHE